MKGNKGITLIALVVTIIVLLILAGVAIAMLTGDNSILKRAQSTQAYSAIGAAKDEVNLAYNAAFAEYLKLKYEATNSTAATTDFATLLHNRIDSTDAAYKNNTAQAHMTARNTNTATTTIVQSTDKITITYTDTQSKLKYTTEASLSTAENAESLGAWTAVKEEANS